MAMSNNQMVIPVVLYCRTTTCTVIVCLNKLQKPTKLLPLIRAVCAGRGSDMDCQRAQSRRETDLGDDLLAWLRHGRRIAIIAVQYVIKL